MRADCEAAYTASIIASGIHPPMALPAEIAFRRAFVVDNLANQSDAVRKEVEEWRERAEMDAEAADGEEEDPRAELLRIQKCVSVLFVRELSNTAQVPG